MNLSMYNIDLFFLSSVFKVQLLKGSCYLCNLKKDDFIDFHKLR